APACSASSSARSVMMVSLLMGGSLLQKWGDAASVGEHPCKIRQQLAPGPRFRGQRRGRVHAADSRPPVALGTRGLCLADFARAPGNPSSSLAAGLAGVPQVSPSLPAPGHLPRGGGASRASTPPWSHAVPSRRHGRWTPHVPRGFALWVAVALQGSSGHGCFG